MNVSTYLKIYPCKEKPGHLLLFSTKNASIATISESTFKAIEEDTLTQPEKESLSKIGMVVQDIEKEKQSVSELFDEINKNNKILNITVVLNLDCNFACKYCYEDDIKGTLYMSDTTADQLIEFIKQKFTDKKEQIILDFYGGEPLLSIELIKYISKGVNSFVAGRVATYSFTLVTNGSLFTRHIAETLVPLGLESVKITLDGPSKIHNHYRPYKSGEGSFNNIIKNIKDTFDLVKINIGGNYERKNYEQFPLLLDYLLNEGITPNKIASIKFDPVMNTPKTNYSSIKYKAGCMTTNESWITEASILLRGEILKRGYNTPKIEPIMCAVENTDTYVVNFNGIIYKCPAFIGKKGFEVGTLITGVKDYRKSYKLGLWKNKQCRECEYLPLCFGGCRYATYVKDGNIDTPNCKKEYFDASLEQLIRQQIKYQLNARTEDNERISIDKLTQKIDSAILKHFPEQFESFIPPGMNRMISSYHRTYSLVKKYTKTKSPNAEYKHFVKSAFNTVAAIRYVDDFIDTALWPDIDKFNPIELTKLFKIFLEDVFENIREFDSEIPEAIMNLPKLELYLRLYPGQDNFDRNFKKLIQYKSFDILYLYHRIHGLANKTTNKELMRLGFVDVVRDFSIENIKNDTDLNLYEHIRSNNINPHKLLSYFISIYKQEDPKGYEIYKKSGLLDGIETNDSVTVKDACETAFPFNDLFLMHLRRAIEMLCNLQTTQNTHL